MRVEVMEMRRQNQQVQKKWKVEIGWRGLKVREVVRGRVAADTPEEAIQKVATEKFRFWGGRVRAEIQCVGEGRYLVDTFIGQARQHGFYVTVQEIR